MIIGHGIDLQEIGTIKQTYEKSNRFTRRVSTDKEFQCSSEQKSTKRQMEFLAGHWTVKEAFVEAMGTGIGILGPKDTEILNDQLGVPVITRSPFSGKCFISFPRTGNLVQASVILEDNS